MSIGKFEEAIEFIYRRQSVAPQMIIIGSCCRREYFVGVQTFRATG